jgi:hypothetical protein
MEHERVVRIRAVTDTNQNLVRRCRRAHEKLNLRELLDLRTANMNASSCFQAVSDTFFDIFSTVKTLWTSQAFLNLQGFGAANRVLTEAYMRDDSHPEPIGQLGRRIGSRRMNPDLEFIPADGTAALGLVQRRF